MKLSNHKVQFGLTIPMAESPAACIFIHLYVQTKKRPCDKRQHLCYDGEIYLSTSVMMWRSIFIVAIMASFIPAWRSTPVTWRMSMVHCIPQVSTIIKATYKWEGHSQQQVTPV